MCNADRNFPVTAQEQEECLRSDRFMRIFDTLRNIENDYPLLVSGGNERAARSSSNFYNAKTNKARDEIKE